jgi:hypothetical protein
VNIVKTKCINDIVIIDGLARSGKFYLGKLVAGINGLEYFINSSEVERIIQINKAGILKSTDASALLLIAMNESIYNMAIGRNINMRHDDGSSVLNSFEKELYINRQSEGVAGEASIKQIINQERSSVFILHQSLQSVDMVKAAAPHSKIINIRRHPVDLVYSWIKKGWGHRFVNDPLSFDLVFQHNGNTVPYFAIEWADEYLAGNEYDRVVKSIVYITEEESRVIDSNQYDICCIYYDNLVQQPNREIDKVCNFLNRSPHGSMYKTIERETRDVEFQSQREMKIDYISTGVKDVSFLNKLIDLGKKYDKNINNGDM